MLNRADNPGLFQYAVLAYNKMASRENQLDLVMTRTLTDEQILSITELEIKPENIVSQFTNLKGLEQFKSLKKLTINGQDDRTNCSKYFGAIERWKSVGEETKERDLEYFKREYNSTQITDKDFEYIKQLPNLQTLNLNNQRNLTKADFSTMPLLNQISMQNCLNLETISGLDELLCYKDSSKHPNKFAEDDARFDFSGCDYLQKITNFEKFIEQQTEMGLVANSNTFFPTSTYAFMCTKNTKLIDILNEDDLIRWTDICPGNIRYETNSRQMQMAKERADNIIRTVCANDTSLVANVASVYRWICDNVSYDYDRLDQEKRERQKDIDRKQNSQARGTNINVIRDKTRSTFEALWHKKAVCAGVSNLFNFFLADLGVPSCRCYCKAESLTSENRQDSTVTIADHAISKLYLTINGEDCAYYFDPTWDLGKSASRYFMLTKEEISVDHNFTIAESSSKSGVSFQPSIINNRFHITRTNSTTKNT